MKEAIAKTKKALTKIKLVNWHYFANTTIGINGTTLFTGSSGSGKSTIMDAVLMAITARTDRFNQAANANTKSEKRTLKGYVRCQTGNEGKPYERDKGPVISYVALEFYEESKKRHFVIGVRLESFTLDSEIEKKWFIVDNAGIDDIAFVVDGKPTTAENFRCKGQKIATESGVGSARNDIKARLGHLDDKFINLLISAMSFKPVTNVKAFINEFILPERPIKIDELRSCIDSIAGFRKLIEKTKGQIEQLDAIIALSEEINNYIHQQHIIDILLKYAEREDNRRRMDEKIQEIEEARLHRSEVQDEITANDSKLADIEQRMQEIKDALEENDAYKAIASMQRSVQELNSAQSKAKREKEELERQIENINRLNSIVVNESLDEADLLLNPGTDADTIRSIYRKIAAAVSKIRNEAFAKSVLLEQEISECETNIDGLNKRIDNLKKNILTYDANVIQLRDAINNEFAVRHIDSSAKILSELLDITDGRWQNAVEGYLNTQRFYILVEPKYYDIAADVYDRMKSKIHTVGLIDAAKLDTAGKAPEESLAYVVSSPDRYAKAYINYVLKKIARCDKTADLKNHNAAITPECMLYKGYVLRKISEETYRDLYIGKQAVKCQREQAERELEHRKEQRLNLKAKYNAYQQTIDAANECDTNAVKSRLTLPAEIKNRADEINTLNAKIKELNNHSDIIALNSQYDELVREKSEIQRSNDDLRGDLRYSLKQIDDMCVRRNDLLLSVKNNDADLDTLVDGNSTDLQDAIARYKESAKRHSAIEVISNFNRERTKAANKIEVGQTTLTNLQRGYDNGNLGTTGMDVIADYYTERGNLVHADLVKYENDFAEEERRYHEEFREDFLVRMAGNLRDAKEEFDKLNASLRNTVYGHDRYRFEISPNPEKKDLYDMMTSKDNVGDGTMFQQAFREQYETEMDELFTKLSSADGDPRILEEYADYRNYIDCDVITIKEDGRRQSYAKTTGLKSGGESQVPFYIVIAASFARIYNQNETVRLVLFDEAFNNMDNDRIDGIMEFLTAQGFQLLVVAPETRADVIGRHVDTTEVVYHQNGRTGVQEFQFPKRKVTNNAQ